MKVMKLKQSYEPSEVSFFLTLKINEFSCHCGDSGGNKHNANHKIYIVHTVSYSI